jgi:hypothetical protein
MPTLPEWQTIIVEACGAIIFTYAAELSLHIVGAPTTEPLQERTEFE